MKNALLQCYAPGRTVKPGATGFLAHEFAGQKDVPFIITYPYGEFIPFL